MTNLTEDCSSGGCRPILKFYVEMLAKTDLTKLAHSGRSKL